MERKEKGEERNEKLEMIMIPIHNITASTTSYGIHATVLWWGQIRNLNCKAAQALYHFQSENFFQESFWGHNPWQKWSKDSGLRLDRKSNPHDFFLAEPLCVTLRKLLTVCVLGYGRIKEIILKISMYCNWNNLMLRMIISKILIYIKIVFIKAHIIFLFFS